MAIERFEEIEAWQLARRLSQAVFSLAEDSALKNDYSLKDQMFRSSGSSMDNIAEGFDSGSNREFIRILQYAKRSCSEVQSQLYRATDRGYCCDAKFQELYELARLTRSKIGSSIRYLTSTFK